MKLVVGLGNPGRKYQGTRHNVGFMAAAKLAAAIGATQVKVKFEGEFAEGSQRGEKIAVLCPQTFMNASGRSVRRAVDFYKLSADDLLVICDDLNLPPGRLRLRASGSAGGQKGLKDIIRHLESESFPRLRIGIGSPPEGYEASDYVLGKFSADERDLIEAATSRAASAALDWACDGIQFAMNRYNPAAGDTAGRTEQPSSNPERPSDN